MVFCGKPSGGCHSCRAKKTRCDQKAEGCSQCKRAKKACPGYRIPGDVIFRNESDNVIKKFKAKEARTKVKASTKVPISDLVAVEVPGDSEEDLEVVCQSATPLSYALAQPIEDQATTFFVANYIIGDQGPTRGHLDYLSNLFQTEVVPECLIASMQAVGLAGYAHAVRAPSLKQNAQYLYMRALKLTNAALRSPDEVKKDSTLVAIMILGIFETVTGFNVKSLDAWAEHVAGASALLHLRGLEQIHTRSGRRIFIQASSTLMISCIQRGKPLPDHIIEWAAIARELLSAPEASWKVLELMMEFTNFNAGVMSGSITDPEVILERSLDFDARCKEFYNNVPPGWEYQTVQLGSDSDCEFIYNGLYHVYFDHWIAQMWNGIRAVRIILHDFIREILLKGFSDKPPRFTTSEHTAQLQSSTEVLYEMQAEILASVPQHLGATPCPTYSSSHAEAPRFLDKNLVVLPWSNFSKHNCNDFPVVRASGPYFLMWPLWFAGSLGIATPSIKEFVARNLRAIGDMMGIQQAIFLAEMTETRSEVKFNPKYRH